MDHGMPHRISTLIKKETCKLAITPLCPPANQEGIWKLEGQRWQPPSCSLCRVSWLSRTPAMRGRAAGRWEGHEGIYRSGTSAAAKTKTTDSGLSLQQRWQTPARVCSEDKGGRLWPEQRTGSWELEAKGRQAYCVDLWCTGL